MTSVCQDSNCLFALTSEIL
uniref:Uncharacterized protein n=1 Tax=Oryza barthii TaxID=65489 RepID=A0A0D3HCL9_9ORYZ